MSGMARKISTIIGGVALAFASLAFIAGAGAQPAAHPPAAADVSSMEAILRSLYDVISGPAGQKRDWDRFRSLFYDGARLIPATRTADGQARARVLDVEGYVTRASGNVSQQGFYEKEIARRVDQFGSIAQVFSTYESRHAADDAKPFARGINSIQLYFDGSRYWIVTILWDAERADNPLPARYLETVKGEK